MPPFIKFSALLILTFLSTSLFSTTIIPFQNLGKMTINTEAVVLAKVIKNKEVSMNGAIRFWSEMVVVDHINGNLNLGDVFNVQNYHLKTVELERVVPGDVEMAEGETYLLFLSNMHSNVWQTTMLTYGLFQEHEKLGQKYLVPVGLGENFGSLPDEEGTVPEKLGVYNSNLLTSHLKDIVNKKTIWDQSKVISRYEIDHFFIDRMLPSHCTTLSGGTIARWEDIETTALPIYYHQSLDAGCPSVVTHLNNAISNINLNYTGLSLVNQSTHNFIPSCSGQGANDGEFVTYINNTYGDSRRHLIQFDDPCSEIADLSGCSGILAVGGLYWFNSTHNYNGMNWRDGAYGFVVVNNGTGACYCSGNSYELLLTHEITHGLNIDHIASGSGAANMNPNCCNAISSLDIECLDFVYAPLAMPIILSDYEASIRAQEVLISWTTQMEINNDYFTVEKMNSYGEFEALEKIRTKGNSDQIKDYIAIDNKPNTGKNYYRLSQTDYDGTTTYFDVKSVNFHDKSRQIIVSNSVQNSQLSLTIYSESNNKAQTIIYSSTGQLIYSFESDLLIGHNEIEKEIQGVTPGIYLLNIKMGYKSESIKIIVQ